VKSDKLCTREVSQDSHMMETQRACSNDPDPRRAGAQMMTPRPLSSRKRRK
jgi:hypothetical protein